MFFKKFFALFASSWLIRTPIDREGAKDAKKHEEVRRAGARSIGRARGTSFHVDFVQFFQLVCKTFDAILSFSDSLVPVAHLRLQLLKVVLKFKDKLSLRFVGALWEAGRQPLEQRHGLLRIVRRIAGEGVTDREPEQHPVLVLFFRILEQIIFVRLCGLRVVPLLEIDLTLLEVIGRGSRGFGLRYRRRSGRRCGLC